MKRKLLLYFLILSLGCGCNNIKVNADVLELSVPQAVYSIKTDKKTDCIAVYATVITPQQIIELTSLNGKDIKEKYNYDFAQAYIEFCVLSESNLDVSQENFTIPLIYNSNIGKYKVTDVSASADTKIYIKSRFIFCRERNGEKFFTYSDWCDKEYINNDYSDNFSLTDEIKIKNQKIDYSEIEYTDGTYPVFIVNLEYSQELLKELQFIRAYGKDKCKLVAEYCTDNEIWKSAYVSNAQNPYIYGERIIVIEQDNIDLSANIKMRIKISYGEDKNTEWCYTEFSENEKIDDIKTSVISLINNNIFSSRYNGIYYIPKSSVSIRLFFYDLFKNLVVLLEI